MRRHSNTAFILLSAISLKSRTRLRSSSTVRLLTTDERMKWHARRVLDVWSQFSLRTAWCSWCWWWRNQKSKVARLARLVGIARRWRFQQITVCWSRWCTHVAQSIAVGKQRTRCMHTLSRRWQSYQIAGAFTQWHECTCGRCVRLLRRVLARLQRHEHKVALRIWRRNIVAGAALEANQRQLIRQVFTRLRFDTMRKAWQHWRNWVRQLILVSRLLARLQLRSVNVAMRLWSARAGLLGQQCTVLYRMQAHQCWRATMSAWRRWLWCITDQSKTEEGSVGLVGSLERKLAHALREQVSTLVFCPANLLLHALFDLTCA